MKAFVLSCCSILLLAVVAHGEERQFVLVASAAPWQIAPGRMVMAYSYNQTVPGPEIRGNAGDVFRIMLVNNLPVPTTIHWHGVAVPNDMDGVPGVTGPVVNPGQTFTYVFHAPSPGTYWYHPHANSADQISMGLYGLLIVDPPADAPRKYDREVSMVIGEYGSMMGAGVSGRGGMGGMAGGTASTLLINGKTAPAIPDLRIRYGERVLFRMVNTGNMVHPMHVHGLHWTIVATDGFDLQTPYKKDTVPINAGERYDGILEADNKGIWMVHCHNLDHVTDLSTGLIFNLVVD